MRCDGGVGALGPRMTLPGVPPGPVALVPLLALLSASDDVYRGARVELPSKATGKGWAEGEGMGGVKCRRGPPTATTENI